MFRGGRFALRFSVRVLCVCAAMAVSTMGHHRAWADRDTWADVSDVAQYLPLAWAAGRTLYSADAEGAAQMAAGGILTVGSSELLKRAIDAERPDYEPGDTRHSFPSGHVAKAWFAAAHLQRRYGCYELRWSCWRGSAVPYIAAVATAAGRVGARRHHLEDVIASAVIAEAWIWVTTDKFDDDTRIAPTFDNGFGIAVLKKF